MPKMKTHSGSKKRFKTTGSGKLTHEQVNRRHLLEVKNSKRRRLMADAPVAKADEKRVKRLLGKRYTQPIVHLTGVSQSKIFPVVKSHWATNARRSKWHA